MSARKHYRGAGLDAGLALAIAAQVSAAHETTPKWLALVGLIMVIVLMCNAGGRIDRAHEVARIRRALETWPHEGER